MPRKIKGYGWTRDLPDGRDMLYAAPPPALAALPRRVDLRKQCPAIYDQGQLGSCTANAIGRALAFDQITQTPRRRAEITSNEARAAAAVSPVAALHLRHRTKDRGDGRLRPVGPDP